ncbi:MAG: hypothetical protein ACOYL5_06475 [Phototrophicaceae bacterium]|jgi:hypothetical protein
MPTPEAPILLHHYYACSWVINHHGLNQLQALADLADELDVGLGVRQMFTDPNGFLIYPFCVRVRDLDHLKGFIGAVAAGIGMDDWYIVNIHYYEQAIPFADNLRKVLVQMPLWESQMRRYADHNRDLHTQRQANPQVPDTEA